MSIAPASGREYPLCVRRDRMCENSSFGRARSTGVWVPADEAQTEEEKIERMSMAHARLASLVAAMGAAIPVGGTLLTLAAEGIAGHTGLVVKPGSSLGASDHGRREGLIVRSPRAGDW